MWITWLVMLRQTSETSFGTSIVRKKTPKVFHPWKGRMERFAQSDLKKAEEFNAQFTDVFNKNEHTQVLLLDRSAPFMNDIVISKDGVIKLLKGLNPSKALRPDELHPRALKELATELGPVYAHLFQQSMDTGEIPKEWSLANVCPLFKKTDLLAIIARFPWLAYLASYSNI